MNAPDKYVVIYELDSGYMDCIAICDTSAEAYGEAYLTLMDGLDADEYYITLPEEREGGNGYIMKSIHKDTGKIFHYVTVLFYRKEDNT